MSLLNPSDLIDKFSHDIESETIYTSTTSNIHSLYAALVIKTVDNVYISKVGDITNTDLHYRGANSALHSENGGVFNVNNCSIKTDGLGSDAVSAYDTGKVILNSTDILTLNELSAGLLSSSDSEIEANGISLYTLGENSPALYMNTSGKIKVTESYIGADISDVILMEGSGTVIVDKSKVFNAEECSVIIADGTNSGNFNISFIDTEFENVSNIIDIKNTDSSRINNIIISQSPFECPIDDDYAIVLDNANSKILLEESFDSNGIGNFLKAINSTVVINAENSNFNGNIIGDDDSEINITIGEKQIFYGSVNAANAKVKLTKSKWILTANTYISELDIDYTSIIDKNGFVLLVDGEDYTDGIVVGSVVHYTTKADKVYDREVLEKNCIVIKKITNEDNANEFILYDADDHLAYKALYSEFRYTGKEVDIAPILQEIEDLLIGIDEYYSDTTIRTKDENTNAIIINGRTYNLDNIIVEKYNDAADEARGLAGENAAVLIKNSTELNLANSTIVSEGKYAPGIYVDESTLNLETTQINTQDQYSPGIIVTNNGSASVKDSNISTISTDSEALKILNGSTVNTELCTITTTGSSYSVYISNIPINDTATPTEYTTDYRDLGSTFNSESTNIINAYAKDTTDDTVININLIDSNINTSETNDTITSLIKCSGDDISDTINISLENVALINPPSSEAFINVDPSTVNLELDSRTTFTQLNDEGYLFKVDEDSALNINARGATIEGRILAQPTSIINLNLYNATFNGVFNSSEEVGSIKVKLVDSTWNMSSDDYISELDIDVNSTIYTNGYDLYINGKIYNPVVDVNDQYQEIEVPTGRILKVLTSNEYSELTTKQDSYIYFLYDKLEMWFEHSQFVSPFCIVEKMPETNDTLVADILYINYSTGKLFIYNDYILKEVGYVEHLANGNSDPEQLAILAAAGTTYFHNAESRYIDVQTRTIILPYQNGSYQICVNIPEDLKITEDTVVYYNREKEQWEVDGYRTSSEFEIPYYNNIKPANSSTVLTQILNKNIVRSELRISSNPNNLVDTMVNGIYVDGSVLATKGEYELLKDTVSEYRAISDSYIIQLRNAVLETAGVVSMDVINEKIMTILREYEGTIDTLIDDYDEIYNRLITVETTLEQTTQDKIDTAKAEILEYLENLRDPWKPLEEDTEIPVLTPAEYQHNAAVYEYGRQQVTQYAEGLSILYVSDIPRNENDIVQNTVYAVWDKEQEIYHMYVWNTSTQSWDGVGPGSTLPLDPSEELNYYRSKNAISINPSNGTVIVNEDAIEGFVYFDESTGKKYLYDGTIFEELT